MSPSWSECALNCVDKQRLSSSQRHEDSPARANECTGPAANYFLTLPLARWTRLTHPSVFGLFSHGDTWTERDFKYFMNQMNCGHFLPLIPAISPGQKP